MSIYNETILREFMNIYWLRPESAVFRAIDVVTMRDFEFRSPSLDFGCGDGLFSFIRGGGGYNISFDVYSDVNVDLTSFFANTDVYDHYNEAVEIINPEKKPSYKIDIALDHKSNLLEKAKRLNFYNDFICHDANEGLPLLNNSIQTVFSNILYWLNNPQNVLNEIGRVLKPGGRAAFMLPDKEFYECSFYYRLYHKAGDKRWKWLEKIDRGRTSDNVKQAKSSDEWESMFNTAGLSVVQHKKHLSKFFINMWDIGLRPLFPVLHKMQSRLSTQDRLEVKKDWIECLMEFAIPIMEIDLLCDKNECVFHYYEVKK